MGEVARRAGARCGNGVDGLRDSEGVVIVRRRLGWSFVVRE